MIEKEGFLLSNISKVPFTNKSELQYKKPIGKNTTSNDTEVITLNLKPYKSIIDTNTYGS